MIISSSVSSGFQKEIKNKIVGFGSHIQINNYNTVNGVESEKMLLNQDFFDDVNNISDVNNIQSYATKAGILQAKVDSNKFSKASKNIHGVVFKGISEDFNWDFFDKNIIEGDIIDSNKNKILISKSVAQKLSLSVDDKISAYFVDEKGPKQRKFEISGIYETGLEEFDEKFVICHISHIQQLNKWDIQTSLFLSTECINNNIVIEAQTTGGFESYEYEWSESIKTINNRVYFCPTKDTAIYVITRPLENNSQNTEIPDTSLIRLNVNLNEVDKCICQLPLNYESLNDSTRRYFNEIGEITTIVSNKDNSSNYCGGFEINLNDFKQIDNKKMEVEEAVGPLFHVTSIDDKHPEIFAWLDLLDTNVYVIIVLLIIVAIINMASTLLVIILEKGQAIGLLKALGGSQNFISKIFISLGGLIILRGLLWGNLIALFIILIQNQFQILTLPQANYFVSVVPMDWSINWFVLIDLGALVICTFALIIPSKIINRISITKAIKLD